MPGSGGARRHESAGTDYPYDMGMYDPRGFVGGCRFLADADKAQILGLNAARLLKITGRLKSMGIRDPRPRRAKRR
ncbi:MAG: hypothetical protein ABW020_07015 [Candidatus Rokuibacteriota bacterium]